MERDSRRGKGQWKGCHTFRDIICDDDSSKTRHGGLKMGHTYYYYVSTLCPLVPSQKPNMEKSLI